MSLRASSLPRRLKDSDVTWLYGPLHTAVDAVPPPKVATANDRLGLEAFRPLDAGKAAAAKEERKKAQKEGKKAATHPVPSTDAPSPVAARSGGTGAGAGRALLAARAAGARSRKPEFKTKPILKYRSLSDILMPQGQPTSPSVEELGIDFEDQATISVHHARSDSHLVRLNSLNRKTKRSSPVHSPGSSSPERTASDSSSASTFLRGSAAQARRNRRHISFNHRVEQCIAIDSSDDVRSYSTASSSDEDEDEVLTFGARSPRPSSFMRTPEPKEPHTIARLGPTTLKSVELYPSPSPAVVFSSDPTEYDDTAASSPPDGGNDEHVESSPYQHPAQQAQQHAAGQQVMYAYSAPDSAIRSQWDPEDDDDYAMGFDYFTGASGPELQIGDEYDTAQYGSTHLIGAAHNNYRGGSVGGVGGADGASDSYLGGGPYSANSPYHPGSSALDPTAHATQQAASQMPHYRDSLPSSSTSPSSASPTASSSSASPSSAGSPASASGPRAISAPSSPQVISAGQRGPHEPPSTRDATTPKRSALKGGRSREASVESAVSSASTSPASGGAPSPALSSASTSPPKGIQAVATAIPPHVMRPGVPRRGTSDDGERGRSASRGSSSSLEREASARRSSSSISPTSSYSPPIGSGGPGAGGSGTSPIVQQGWRGSASYDSLSSVMSGGGTWSGAAPRAGGGLGGSYSNLPDVPESSSGESSPQGALRIGVGSAQSQSGGGAGLGRLITSSSVDSMGSLGSYGAGPNTPTSPTMPSPARRYQSLVPEEDDNAQVEDVAVRSTVPATVDDSEGAAAPATEPAPAPAPALAPAAAPKPDAASSAPSTSASAPAATGATLGHSRTPSGPRLRNPSPATAETTKATATEVRPSSPGETGASPSASSPSSAAGAPDSSASNGGPSLLKRSPSSNSLSYARQSLLRATQRDESASRSSVDGGSSPSLSSSTGRGSLDSARGGEADGGAPASASAGASAKHDGAAHAHAHAGHDDEFGAAAVGGGINVAGTARDLLGAISKGIWGSLGGRGSGGR